MILGDGSDEYAYRLIYKYTLGQRCAYITHSYLLWQLRGIFSLVVDVWYIYKLKWAANLHYSISAYPGISFTYTGCDKTPFVTVMRLNSHTYNTYSYEI